MCIRDRGYGLFRFDLTPAGSGHPDHLISHRAGNKNLYLKFLTATDAWSTICHKALKMHTTQELWQAALRDPVLQGVFSSDKSPVI